MDLTAPRQSNSPTDSSEETKTQASTTCDPQQGRAIAARFGAGRYVLGNVTQLGQEIRISASLYDAEAQVEERAEAVAEDLDGLPSAVDTLVIQLIGDLVAAPLKDLVSVAVRTTHDQKALKEYLKGELAISLTPMREGGYRSPSLREPGPYAL